MENTLFYGDNLTVLREHIGTSSVDLVYLDPPFNSSRNYNVLFKDEHGKEADAQIIAFEDTWHWNTPTAAAYEELIERSDEVSKMIGALREFIGTNQMMAYLVMMAARLVELQRVLKPTGSLYLHCDPTASHYLKILLDTIFGVENFRNEIIWKRTSGHSDAVRYGSIHDTIFYYSNGPQPTRNHVFQPYAEEYVEQYYRYQDPDGRRWMSGDLSAAGLAGGGYDYEWKGVTRVWRAPQSTMERYEREGRLFYTKNGIPRLKRYLDESNGMPAQDLWDDLEALRSWHKERLGYPTQKPLALLERIIRASSNEGDVVLDPFCGCGTAIVAAQKLNRKWLGIDITHLAIALMRNRLKDSFDLDHVRVIGEPTSVQGAEQLAADDKYQFQWWALSLIEARPLGGQEGSREGKKGSDRGIDGIISFIDDPTGKPKRVIVQVKGGNIKSGDVRDLVGTVQREGAAIGVFISLKPPTPEMQREAAAAGFYQSPNWQRSYPRIQLLTIEQLLHGATVQMPPTKTTMKRAQSITSAEQMTMGGL